jgi:hypothetical protein
VEYGINFAGNANAKRVTWSVTGAVNWEDSGLIDVRSLGVIHKLRLVRRNSTSIISHSLLNEGILQTNSAGVNSVTGIGGRMNQRAGYITVPDMNTLPMTLTFSGQGTTNGDVGLYLAIIDRKRAKTVRLT